MNAEGLNQAQKEAVLQTEGPLLILAGAGSGKTRVITHRIAHLIFEKKIPPRSIFAVTFTNKAAEEMKRRVIELSGPGGHDVFVKTFHSAAVFILRYYGSAVGIPRYFSIYDAGDSQSLIKEILKDMQLDPKQVKPSVLYSKISEIKDSPVYVNGEDFTGLLPSYGTFNFFSVFKTYNEKLALSSALDFNDLLVKTVHLLRSSPEILKSLQERWQYFMIDEYQDTNYAQYIIAGALAAASRNICVVGDDDQSIYSWRGADIRNILGFEKDYPDAKVVTLNVNYRSSSPILQAASAIIENNTQRKKKNIEACIKDGEAPVWCRAESDYSEAEYVIKTILSLRHIENLKNPDFAVFYRTNAQSRLFEEFLRKGNIPYRVVGGLKFYDRKEIRDILAYLRFINNPLDGISLARIINTPARGIGNATYSKLYEYAAGEKTGLWDIINSGIYPGKLPAGIKSFAGIINELQAVAGGIPESSKLSALIKDVFMKSGYHGSLNEENTPESRSRIENLEELINSVIDYETANPSAGLNEFLQDISLLTSEENPVEGQDRNNAVTLMTVHNAKGLEFPVVFLTGMQENTFPHRFSIESEDAVNSIEEERRLCYVGITRAKQRLFITSCDRKRTFSGQYDFNSPSRFISEIPPELLEKKYFPGTIPRETTYSRSNLKPSEPVKKYSWKNTVTAASLLKSGSLKKENTKNDGISPDDSEEGKPASAGQNNPDSRFAKGDRVRHPDYGKGIVTGIETGGENIKLTINFSGKSRLFVEKYAPLEKI